MPAKAFTNILKRGKEFVRLVLSKNGPQPAPADIRQPRTDVLRYQQPQTVAPVRTFLFTSRVSYKTVASQLRRRAALQFGRKQQLPFFGFVGLALATSKHTENDNLSLEIREVLQKRIKTSHIIQQLSLDSFDFGEVIGRGCNAVVYEAKYHQQEDRETISLEKSSDYVENPISQNSEDFVDQEQDKWYPPEQIINTQEKTTQSVLTNTSEVDNLSHSFTILDRGESDSFSVISSGDENGSFWLCDDQDFVLESLSISESAEKTGSLKENDHHDFVIEPLLISELADTTGAVFNDDGCSDTTEEDEVMDLEDDKWSFTEDEDDKWSLIDELDYTCIESLEESNDTKYKLAVKMMFNYDVESNADSIIKAMEKETVPARIPVYQLEDSWYLGNRVRLKSLPQHPNIVDMVGAFVDPVNVPKMSVAMETYPAALPRRLYSNGLGRNMTMYIVMKRYDMTLRQYLEEKKPNIRTRCVLLTQILEGILHLGNHGIAHRDIKSDNLFIDLSDDGSLPNLVIGDFGCCLADPEFKQKLPYFTQDVDRGGNCSLMAPEISTAVPGRDVWLDYSKADLWAVGTLVYELFGLLNPFYPSQSQRYLDSRTYDEGDLPTMPESVPGFIRSLSLMILQREPNKRISPLDAANLMQMFLWLPEWFVNKPSLTEIKEHLLVQTAEVILQGQSMDTEHHLQATFLQRLDLNDLSRILDSCY